MSVIERCGVASPRGRVEISRPSRNTVTLVGDLEDFLHAVADEEDGDALVAQVADQLEQLRDLVGRQRGGRLVHDQDADIERDRLGDLDRLLRGKRQAARRAAHVEGDAELGEDRLGVAEHLPPADHLAAVLMADEDVLGDVEVGKEQRLLIDRGDAEALALGGVADGHRLAGEQDFAAIGLVDAGHDLDQGRLAGAVFAEQRVDFAGIERQRHVLERLGGVEPLGDVAHFKNRGCRPAIGPPGAPVPRPRRVPFQTPSSASASLSFRCGRPFVGPSRLRFSRCDYIETLSHTASVSRFSAHPVENN